MNGVKSEQSKALDCETTGRMCPPWYSDGFSPVSVLPTYNNDRTLINVMESIEALKLPMIVVNDGSSDATASLLDTWSKHRTEPGGWVVTHRANCGKAKALRSGFDQARQLGFSHALTMDTDGQHDAKDVPDLLRSAAKSPEAMVLGTRHGGPAVAPHRHRLGRTISDALSSWVSGTTLADSQCGLRVYPLQRLASLSCRSSHYAYETEVVIRAAQAGWPIIQVPVTGRYLPPNQCVSHFRPLLDSLRWSLMMLRLMCASRGCLSGTQPADTLPDSDWSGVLTRRRER